MTGLKDTFNGRSKVIAMFVDRVSPISNITVKLSSTPSMLSSLYKYAFLMSIPSNKGYATTPLNTAVNVSPVEVLTKMPILLKGLLASKETGLVTLIIFIEIV